MVARVLLRNTLEAALDATAPDIVIPPVLPEPPRGRTVVIGAGKASAAMAAAVERHWPNELSGLVVVPYGYAVPCARVEVAEAAHPLPDEFGLAAARKMLSLVSALGPDDLVLALLSGGGSALLPLPAGAVTLEDKRALTAELLRAGASIGEINYVRKHLSALKGGWLACAAAPAQVVNILVSEVADDEPAVIASGPTVPDPSTLADARRVLAAYGLRISLAVKRHLEDPSHETPKPDNPCFARVSTHIVASGQSMVQAAAAYLQHQGLRTHIISHCVEGDSAQTARAHAQLVLRSAQGRGPLAPPCALVSGGETTVSLKGTGRGGPNMEYLLALATSIDEAASYVALACDTDGSDGSTGIAGAFADHTTLRRAAELHLDARAMLENNDSLTFFEALGDLVVTGPTFNNLNDLRVILVLGPASRVELSRERE
jgi:hydroxypyruvate reductase